MNRTTLASLTLIATLAAAGPALAHAHLTRAVPADGAVLKAAPAQLELRFSEGVEARFTRVELKDATGKAVAIGTIATAPADKKVLHVTPAAALAPGRYEVVWRAVSVDTHKSEGRYGFSVQP